MEITTKETIVTDGLVLHLDAVSGFGTDLSGNGNIPSMSNNIYDGQSYQLTSNSENTLSGTNLSLTGAEFTIESWIYYVGNSFEGDYGQIFSQDDGFSGGQGWQWRIPNLGDIPEFIYWTSSSRSSAVGFSYNTALVPGNWYHIVVSYDGTDIKGYINGSLDVTHTPASSLYGSTASIGIGMFSGTRNVLNGKISIIRAYKNYYLSEEQIYKNYINQKGRFFGQSNMSIATIENIITNNLALYLDANNRNSYPGSGTTWTDLSGNGNNATLINGPSYSSANGGSIVFDGVDDYADCGSSLLLSRPFTINCWVYFNSLTGWQTFVCQDTSQSSIPASVYFQKVHDSSGTGGRTFNTFGIALLNTDNNTVFCYDTTPVQTGIWYNYCVSVSTTQLLLYRNGNLIATTNDSSTMAPTTGSLYVGCGYFDDNLVDYVNGRISNTKIYNRALTASEIQQNYDNQKGRFFGQDNCAIENKQRSGLVLYLDSAIETSYPGYGTRWFDLSGYRSNGTLLNGVGYNSGDGGYLSFDGIDDYITVPYSTIFDMTNLTVVSWFYISSFPDFTQYRIIDHQETPERAWGLQMGRGDYVGGGYTSSDIILFCHSNNGISQKNLPCSTKLSLNTWYHAAFSNDGTTLKIYLNGSLTDTTSSLGDQYSSISNDIVIGCSGQTRDQFFWNGRISHCSVYNRALTESEIEEDYIKQIDRFLG